jgi:hypothetical protein
MNMTTGLIVMAVILGSLYFGRRAQRKKRESAGPSPS